MKLDLHVHTNYSDGSFTLEEVIALAKKRKVKVLAITDHDVISALPQIEKYQTDKLKIIPGIELSARVNCSPDEIHIVGLGIDYKNSEMQKLSREVCDFQKAKTKLKIARVNEYFHADITYEDVQKKTLGVPSTPHIAMVLMDRGLVKTIGDSIRVMLKHGPCFIDYTAAGLKQKKIHAKEAIRMIHDSGGIAVLAHLADYKKHHKFKTYKEQEELVKELADYNIDAMEVYTPAISKRDFSFLSRMAKKYDLLTSGGSDFHNEKHLPQNRLGYLDLTEKEISVLRKL